MNCLFELRAARDIWVTADSYWKTAIQANGMALNGSEGLEEYRVNGTILRGQRVASFGQQFFFVTDIHSLTFCIYTNIILDPGLLTYSLTLAISQEGEAWQEIPLSSPCIRVHWPKRGTYEATINRF